VAWHSARKNETAKVAQFCPTPKMLDRIIHRCRVDSTVPVIKVWSCLWVVCLWLKVGLVIITVHKEQTSYSQYANWIIAWRALVLLNSPVIHAPALMKFWPTRAAGVAVSRYVGKRCCMYVHYVIDNH